MNNELFCLFFFSSRRRHTRLQGDWSSDVCSSDLPGRIRSIHCKDWSAEGGKGYTVLFGEGAADWKNIFAAAESVGGIEYYLVEQEGSRFSEFDTAKRCLQTFHRLRPV